MSKAVKKIYTFTDLVELWSKDLSTVAKKVKEYGIATIPTIQNDHACQAITQADKDLLEKENPNFVVPLITKSDVEINALAAERKQDVAGLLKFLKSHDYVLEKRLRPEGGRPVNVLGEKEYKRLNKENPPRVKVK